MLNVLPGRYSILMLDGTSCYCDATAEQIERLRLRIAQGPLRLTVAGFGWIEVKDYTRYPANTPIASFL